MDVVPKQQQRFDKLSVYRWTCIFKQSQVSIADLIEDPKRVASTERGHHPAVSIWFDWFCSRFCSRFRKCITIGYLYICTIYYFKKRRYSLHKAVQSGQSSWADGPCSFEALPDSAAGLFSNWWNSHCSIVYTGLQCCFDCQTAGIAAKIILAQISTPDGTVMLMLLNIKGFEVQSIIPFFTFIQI